MTVILELTAEEEARLQEMAGRRGVAPSQQAHEMLSGLLTPPPQAHRERLIAAARAGDTQAKMELWEMRPQGIAIDPATSLPYPSMPREALSREALYEDCPSGDSC